MPYNNDSFFAIFESMNVGTQFSDSSNEANIYPPYIMTILGYGQPFPNSSISSSSTNEEYGMLTILFYTNVILHSISDVRRISNEHMGETKVSYHGEVVGRTQEIYAWHIFTYN